MSNISKSFQYSRFTNQHRAGQYVVLRVRAEAAIESLVYAVAEGDLTRGEVPEFFADILNQALAGTQSIIPIYVGSLRTFPFVAVIAHFLQTKPSLRYFPQ